MLDLLSQVGGNTLAHTNSLDISHIKRMNKTNYFQLNECTFKFRDTALFELPPGIMVLLRKRGGIVEAITQNCSDNLISELGGKLLLDLLHIGSALRNDKERIIVQISPSNGSNFYVGSKGGWKYLASRTEKETDGYKVLIIHTMTRHHEGDLTLNVLCERTQISDEWIPKFKIYQDEIEWRRRHRALDHLKDWAVYQIDANDDPYNIELPVLKMVKVRL